MKVKAKVRVEKPTLEWDDVSVCKRRGWGVGTRLVGDEGYGPTVIEITALGRETLLAVTISQNGEPLPERESSWTLAYRKWKEVPREESPPARGGDSA